jgi:hypothetical protein
VGRELSSENRRLFQNSEDFHAEAVRQVERYRQVIPQRFMEAPSVDEHSNMLRLPSNDDAGLWRVHVKVSIHRLRLSD